MLLILCRFLALGGGVLAGMDFKDFAGSTVVHAFGGFGALACVMVLGPRKVGTPVALSQFMHVSH